MTVVASEEVAPDRLAEEGRSGGGCSVQRAQILLRRLWNSPNTRRAPAPKSYPPITSIPRTSAARLALAASGTESDTDADTVLYLAYGSNLCAETFLGMRGIRPLSQVNVSAPAFDLTFDLPGLPYQEPCFANTAPRKLPKPPVPIPIPGDPPKFPPPLSVGLDGEGREEESASDSETSSLLPPLPLSPALLGDGPTWSKGLYGVVYEVTPEDYAKIVATEGGGASYRDVLTPCLAFPPAMRIPEKPPIPELPKTFFAHTLYAPRLPEVPSSPSPSPSPSPSSSSPPSNEGGDEDDKKKMKSWFARLLLPPRRPSPGYAQPSPRYLKLIRDGAREHALPDDYQAYLASLAAYRRTTWRQEAGRLLFLALAAPPLALVLALSQALADEEGRVPRRLGLAATVLLNLLWALYDAVFRPVFGEGERTVEVEDEDEQKRGGRWRGGRNGDGKGGRERDGLL
ncbi:hypothetical protein F5X96DRAFT_457833 [Biscogniauxia mediterranea]|nr:hypothetical protein F5X96DRAFT_457833 [Biscogniauxia mediterranea]